MILFLLFLTLVNFQNTEAALDNAKISGNITLCHSLLRELVNYRSNPATEGFPVPVRHITANPRFYARGWGDDVIVDSAYSFQNISFDCRSDGAIFLAASWSSFSEDTIGIKILYSTNGGLSWDWFADLGGDGFGFNLINPSMKILEGDDDTCLTMAFEAVPISNPNDGLLCIWRINLNNMADSTFTISDNPNIRETHPCLETDDIQYPYAPYLYCTWTENDSIIFSRSLDRGRNWQDRKCLKPGNVNQHYSHSRCAYGWYDADSLTLCVVWEYLNVPANRINIGCVLNWGFGNDYAWRNPVAFYPPSNCKEFTPAIAATHRVHSFVIFFNRLDTLQGISKLAYKFTYTNPASWSEGTLDSSNVNYRPSVMSGDTSSVYRLLYCLDDHLWSSDARYESLNPPSWSVPARISDDSSSAILAFSGALLFNSSAVAWVSQDSVNQIIKFDAQWMTGIGEGGGEPAYLSRINAYPNPVRKSIFLTLPGKTGLPIKMALYDRAGRIVRMYQVPAGDQIVLDVSDLSSGVYFAVCHISGTAYLSKFIVVE